MSHLGDRIAAFVDGQLPPDEHRAAEAHVAECDECRDMVEDQRQLKSRMNSVGAIEAPQHLMASLTDVEQLAARAAKRPRGIRRCLRSTSIRMLVAVTGASVTVSVLAYAVGHPEEPELPTVEPSVQRFATEFERLTPPSDIDIATNSQDMTAAEVGVSRFTSGLAGPGDGDDPSAVSMLRNADVPDAYVDQLAQNYQIWFGAVGGVGGRPALEVRVGRGGEALTALWVDLLTHRLLRRIDFGVDGSVSASYDYSTSTPADGPAAVSKAGRISPETLEALTRSGWPSHETLGDDLARMHSHWVTVDTEDVVRLTYTDGLTQLSLYEQHGDLSESSLEGFEQRNPVDGVPVWYRGGNPDVAVWSTKGVVYTAVTNAAPRVLWEVVADLPHERVEAPSPLDRITTGVSRMSSWALPG